MLTYDQNEFEQRWATFDVGLRDLRALETLLVDVRAELERLCELVPAAEDAVPPTEAAMYAAIAVVRQAHQQTQTDAHTVRRARSGNPAELRAAERTQQMGLEALPLAE